MPGSTAGARVGIGRRARRVARLGLDGAFGAMSRGAARAGLDVVRSNYHSPIPDLDRLPPTHFSEPHPMPGVAWDLDAQLALLEGELAGHLAERSFPRRADSGFYLENDSYESVDAETLWALVRHLEPRRILELGSGFTTLLLAEAAEANRREGHPVELAVFDPYPKRVLDALPPGRIELARVAGLDVPLERFLELRANDVLFVDTTHTVKAGSEVNRIVLEILPRLAPGVVVHFPRRLPALRVPGAVVEEAALVLGRAVPPAGVPRLQRELRGAARNQCPHASPAGPGPRADPLVRAGSRPRRLLDSAAVAARP